MRIERTIFESFLLVFLICLWGCEDNAASTESCLENASFCPRGSQCAVDPNGTPYCMPATPDGRPDVTVVSLDDAMSTQGGTLRQDRMILLMAVWVQTQVAQRMTQ